MDRTVGAVHRMVFDPEVRAVNEDNREVLHLISSDSTDRAGDVVDPGGAQLDNFMRGPRSVFVDHDYRIDRIIGKAVEVKTEKNRIWARTAFADNDLGREAFSLVKGGFAGAWSIGFRPLEFDSIKDEKGRTKGFRFTSWEMLEYSLVAIPMNPDAVENLVQNGVVSKGNINRLFNVAAPPAESGPSVAEVEATNAETEELLKTFAEASERLARRSEALAVESRLRELGIMR